MGRIYNAGSKFAKDIKDTILNKGWNINDYQVIIAEYNNKQHGKKYRIFDKADKDGETFAQVIANYKVDKSVAIA